MTYPKNKEPKRKVGTIEFPHGVKMDVWPNAVFSHMPDGETTPAAPNRNEDIFDTMGHEVAHHIAAHFLTQGPSLCLENGGKNRDWTERRVREEQAALSWGPILAQALRAAARLPRGAQINRRFSADQVRSIRERFAYRQGRETVIGMAREHGVSETLIRQIATGVIYKDVR